jgi:hypothetical protein
MSSISSGTTFGLTDPNFFGASLVSSAVTPEFPIRNDSQVNDN